MRPRQRVLAVLNGDQPDCVPWFGDLDYWATSLICRGQKPEGFKLSDEYLDWHRKLGVGFYLQGFFPFKERFENCRVNEYRDGNVRVREIETPKGKLTEKWQWMPQSFTEGPVEHLIKTAADLAAYIFMHENAVYEPDNSIIETRQDQIGEAGILMAYLPKSPLMQLVARDAGIMTVMDLFMTVPEELSYAIKTLRTSHDKGARISTDSAVDALMIPENLSAELIGPHLFELYMEDYQRHWAGEMEKAGKFSCIHMDGTLKGLLREESKVGLTFIEAMTPAPVGDLEIENWKSFCGETKTVFWGGIPGCYLTNMISDSDFDDFVIKVLEVMRSEPRYVLGIADQAPPDTIEARVLRIGELAEKHGRY